MRISHATPRPALPGEGTSVVPALSRDDNAISGDWLLVIHNINSLPKERVGIPRSRDALEAAGRQA
jgi:hypothetical protein